MSTPSLPRGGPAGSPRRPRRGRPGLLILLLLVAVPILEVAALIAVGRAVGVWWTLLALLVMSVGGALLMRHEGSATWRALREALSTGRMPAREVSDAALVLVGGALLLLPGFLTDIVGLFLILPLTRPLTRRWLQSATERRVMAQANIVRSVRIDPPSG